jgi:hypothetical protein
MISRWSLVSVLAGAVLASGTLAAPAHAATTAVVSLQITRPNSGEPATTIYPAADGYLDTVSVTGAAPDATVVHIDVSTSATDAEGARVFQTEVSVDWAGDFHVTLGADLVGKVTSGAYYVWARPDDVTDASAWRSAPLTISLQHLVTRTWTKTVSAARSRWDSFVGRCSTLRKPALRGWKGSLGFYSNTKCRKTAEKSAVATVHQIVLPAVPRPGRYSTFRISAYGGAARKKPRSRAYLVYLAANDTTDVVAAPSLGRKVGKHAGPTVAASIIRAGVGESRTFRWGAMVQSGNRYDVKSFTVTVTYTALQ